jgi:hypothetical protein
VISIKQRERERRAVAEFACPHLLCRAPVGQPCVTLRGSQVKPRMHPHEQRVWLVADWTKDGVPVQPAVDPAVAADMHRVAEKYLEHALYEMHSNVDPIGTVDGALALLRMAVGEYPSDDFEGLRKAAEGWEE